MGGNKQSNVYYYKKCDDSFGGLTHDFWTLGAAYPFHLLAVCFFVVYLTLNINMMLTKNLDLFFPPIS